MIYSAEGSGAPHRRGGCVGRDGVDGEGVDGEGVGRGMVARPHKGERHGRDGTG